MARTSWAINYGNLFKGGERIELSSLDHICDKMVIKTKNFIPSLLFKDGGYGEVFAVEPKGTFTHH